MKKTLELRIARPCEESWERMPPEGQGRFCAACSKTVVDLTGFSDQELLAFLGRAGKNTCGRFSAGTASNGCASTG